MYAIIIIIMMQLVHACNAELISITCNDVNNFFYISISQSVEKKLWLARLCVCHIAHTQEINGWG